MHFYFYLFSFLVVWSENTTFVPKLESTSSQNSMIRKSTKEDIPFILALIDEARQKMVAEGAGAVSVAAAMFNKVPVAGKKTICIVSGGNIDVTILNRVINRGLFKSGRTYTFVVELDDKPGQLVGVSQIVASLGGNVISVRHERNDDAERVTACQLRLKVETRDEEQINEIRKALKKNHYKLV